MPSAKERCTRRNYVLAFERRKARTTKEDVPGKNEG